MQTPEHTDAAGQPAQLAEEAGPGIEPPLLSRMARAVAIGMLVVFGLIGLASLAAMLLQVR